MNTALKAGFAGALLGFVLAACTVKLDDGLRYTCTADTDCGGEGWKCTASTGKGWCCKPSPDGVEVCNGKDDDCDGKVDNTGKAEVCNGKDDDCNGKTDEGFDLNTQAANCGSCTTQCQANEECVVGKCTRRTETACNDNLDNDNNGLTDCADPSCKDQSCGQGCACDGHQKSEFICDDTVDNDGDTKTDCDDSDCAGRSCGPGCQCGTDGGVKRESDCFDAKDNDGDGFIDCADPDCLGNYCTDTSMGLYFTCAPGGVCNCNGGQMIQEATRVFCSDGIDNDCDGVKDCGDPHCDLKGCTSLNDTDCVCKNGIKTEGNCGNLADDDGDGKTDCADSDCAPGTACTKGAGGAGTCSSGTCQ